MERTNLLLFRVKHKLSQEKMAKRIGYTRSHYASIESGKREVTLKFINGLSKGFSLPIAEAMELVKSDNE